MSTWLLIPAPASRLGELQRCLDAASMDGEAVVVVTTQPDPIPAGQVDANVIVYDEPDVNIAAWWAYGLDWIAEREHGDYEVLIASSDVGIRPAGIGRLAQVLRELDLAMTSADWFHVLPAGKVHVNRSPRPVDHIYYRIPGVAMMLAGELGIRPDPQFRWWYADDDLEWQARASKGTGLVAGVDLGHDRIGSPLSEEKARWAIEDHAKFVTKWGSTNL